MSEIKCKKCGHNLFQKSEGKVKLRTNIIVFEKGEDNDFDNSNAIIKCNNCRADNEVPIILNTNNVEIKHFIFEK